MIDLDNLKFWYEKEEVDAYMMEKHVPIEDVLQLLITNVWTACKVLLYRFESMLVCLSLNSKLVLASTRIVDESFSERILNCTEQQLIMFAMKSNHYL